MANCEKHYEHTASTYQTTRIYTTAILHLPPFLRLKLSNMFSNIPALALLIASASAAAVPYYPTASWVWSVSDYTSTCTASECRYGLKVSAPVGPSGEPAFDATGCIGNSVQGDYKSCAVVGIDVPGDVLTEQFNHGIDVGASLSVRVTFSR